MSLEEVLGVKGTLVMSPADMRTYVYERKLSPDESFRRAQTERLRAIIIHNALLEHEVAVEILESAGLEYVSYIPAKSTEKHFYVPETGHLHIVNSRGVIRKKRDEDLAKVLGHFLDIDRNDGAQIKVSVHNYRQDGAAAAHRFDDFAFNLVADLLENLNTEYIRPNGRLSLIMGPFSSLKVNQEDVIHERADEYLNSRIIRVGGEQAVNLDYIFADQAAKVLDKLYSGLSERIGGLAVNVFLYGKAGVLSPSLQVGSIMVPTHAMEEGDLVKFTLNNKLQEDPYLGMFRADVGDAALGTTLNSISVIGQTIEGLLAAREQGEPEEQGASMVDMEVAAMTRPAWRTIYPNITRINRITAFVGSDCPLQGKNLGNTPYPADVEQQVASSFLKMMGEMRWQK